VDHADLLLTAVEAAPLLGVRPATITKWASRGRLSAAGHLGRVALYRWGDLVEAEYQTRRTGHLRAPRDLSEYGG
jgi:Helix-turn-helix domain